MNQLTHSTEPTRHENYMVRLKICLSTFDQLGKCCRSALQPISHAQDWNRINAQRVIVLGAPRLTFR